MSEDEYLGTIYIVVGSIVFIVFLVIAILGIVLLFDTIQGLIWQGLSDAFGVLTSILELVAPIVVWSQTSTGPLLHSVWVFPVDISIWAFDNTILIAWKYGPQLLVKAWVWAFPGDISGESETETQTPT